MSTQLWLCKRSRCQCESVKGRGRGEGGSEDFGGSVVLVSQVLFARLGMLYEAEAEGFELALSRKERMTRRGFL